MTLLIVGAVTALCLAAIAAPVYCLLDALEAELTGKQVQVRSMSAQVGRGLRVLVEFIHTLGGLLPPPRYPLLRRRP